MDTPDGKKLTAAYAPLNSVVLVIRRVRDRGAPDVVTNELLQSYGVSEANSPRTLAALKFLGLLADDGRPTPEFERLNRAPSEDAYKQAFGEILRSAYKAVFAIVDPTTAASVDINNAFRQYNPPAQRSRMVSLFIGLLSEANLVDREPPSGQTRRSPKRQSAQRLLPSRRAPLKLQRRKTQSVSTCGRSILLLSSCPARGGGPATVGTSGYRCSRRRLTTALRRGSSCLRRCRRLGAPAPPSLQGTVTRSPERPLPWGPPD